LPVIEWALPGNRLAGGADTDDIFLGELPPIRVRRVSEFTEDRLALCCDIGEGVSRIRLEGTSDTVLRKLPVSGPCRGKIWVETLGRVRAPDYGAQRQLFFCLLPPCSIRWPSGLYGEDEEPLIALHTVSPIHCEFPDCERVAGQDQAWKVPRERTWVEGELCAGGVAVRVAHRILRASVEENDGTPLVVEKSALEQDGSVRVRGLPGDRVSLRARRPDGKSAELPLLQRFDQHGVAIVHRSDLRDALARIPTAPMLALDVWSGRWVTSQARIVDLKAVEQWLFDDCRKTGSEWIEWLSTDFTNTLLALARKLDGAEEFDTLPLAELLPLFLANWAKGIFACIWVFSTPEDQPAPPTLAQMLAEVPAELRGTLDWVLRAKAALRDGSEAVGTLCAEYEHLGKMRHWPPWGERLRDLYARVAANAELSPLIEEWRGDVLAGLREPTSALGLMRGGRQLTHAFVHYLAGRPQAAYRTLFEISADAPQIIVDLRSVLLILLILNFSATSHLPDEPSPRCHRRLRPLLVAMRVLLARKLGEPLPAAIGLADPISLELLPLQSNDLAAIRAALETLAFRSSESR